MEGIIIGAVSAVFSAAVTALIYSRVMAAIGDSLNEILSMPAIPVGSLTLILLGVFLLLGAGIGAVGSAISMRRFLDV